MKFRVSDKDNLEVGFVHAESLGEAGQGAIGAGYIPNGLGLVVETDAALAYADDTQSFMVKQVPSKDEIAAALTEQGVIPETQIEAMAVAIEAGTPIPGTITEGAEAN